MEGPGTGGTKEPELKTDWGFGGIDEKWQGGADDEHRMREWFLQELSVSGHWKESGSRTSTGSQGILRNITNSHDGVSVWPGC